MSFTGNGGMTSRARRTRRPVSELVIRIHAIPFSASPLSIIALWTALTFACDPAAAAPNTTEGCADISLSELVKDPLLESLYGRPGWGRLDHDKLLPSGAYGANALFEQQRAPRWFIEEQRRGADAVEAGVLDNDPASVDEAFKVFAWGFSRQGADGGFDGTGDAFHSTSFFVEAVARSLIVLKETEDPRYRRWSEAFLPGLHRAAVWLTKPEVARKGKESNRPYVHRRWLVAAALGLVAELTEDRDLAREANRSAEDGLALQAPDGHNPEKGGYDVSYNAVGLVFAEHYFTTLRCDVDRDLKMQVRRMLERSLRWQGQKVEASGEVDAAGSTRVGHEVSRVGKSKTPAYGQISRAFVFGAVVADEPQFRALAERIADHRWPRKRTSPARPSDPLSGDVAPK